LQVREPKSASIVYLPMKRFAGISTLALLATAAFAQAPPQNNTAQAGPQPTVRCAPVQPPQPGAERDPRSQQTTGQSRETLSDRLAQADGVLCPPSDIDPQMSKRPPETGNMPVLPPPGSPGGDPTVRPK
jgi:hypothetical protein